MSRTHRVVFRPKAEQDLFNLYDFIASSSGRLRAGDYIGRIERLCLTLANFPERGTRRDDLMPGIRMIGFERRVSILFQVNSGEVEILRVLYG